MAFAMPDRAAASRCASARQACAVPEVEVLDGAIGPGVEVVAQPVPAHRGLARAGVGRARSLRGRRRRVGRRVLRGGEGRLRAGVLRSRRGHRVASGRGGDRRSVPRWAAVLARGAGRRPARQRLLDAASGLRARADAREHARGARGGASDPPTGCARPTAGQRRRRWPPVRRHRRRHGDQRDRRSAVAAGPAT